MPIRIRLTGGVEEACPFSRGIKSEAREVIRVVAEAIHGAAEPHRREIEEMLAALLAKSPFRLPQTAKVRNLIPIERLVNRATMARLRREFARAIVDWENEDEISFDLRLAALAEKNLAGHKKAIVGEGYDWEEVITAAMEVGMW